MVTPQCLAIPLNASEQTIKDLSNPVGVVKEDFMVRSVLNHIFRQGTGDERHRAGTLFIYLEGPVLDSCQVMEDHYGASMRQVFSRSIDGGEVGQGGTVLVIVLEEQRPGSRWDALEASLEEFLVQD